MNALRNRLRLRQQKQLFQRQLAAQRPPEGGFFFWINTSWYGTDEEVVAYLAKEANVLVSAGSMCNDPNCIRLIYGALKDRAACIDAVKRIKAALEKHPRNMA